MDIRTIFVLLIIGHVLISILSFGYFSKNSNSIFKVPFYAQVLFVIAYALLYYQTLVISTVFMILGNSILILALVMQMIVLLMEIKAWTSKVKKFYIFSITFSYVTIIAYAILGNDLSRSIGIFSLVRIVIVFYPTYRLLSDNESTFYRRTLGFAYVISLLIYVIRGIEVFSITQDPLFLDSSESSLLTVTNFYLLMIVNGVGLLFLFKENDDVELTKLATRDSLTGIYNRSYLITECNKLIELHRRKKRPLTFVVMDIDLFKQVNDTYGHTAGDNVLKTLAFVVSKNIRPYDLFGRVGGEEFVVVLIDTEKSIGYTIAERIRKEIEKTDMDGINITISIGLYTKIPGEEDSFNDLFKQADKALYYAKNGGRNKTCISNQEENYFVELEV